MTRIIGGVAGGRRLAVPPRGTRPTTDRVRESLFNILAARRELTGLAVLDLYAGSGALGLEALSRGAATALFVESDPRAAAVIARNIDTLLDPAYVPSCTITPILSCGSVMITPQASLLGFPNPLLGLVAFTVVVVTGLLAVTKVVLPQWYWMGLTAGLVVGAVF
ncbi:RsmD family RNA methyltransferase, partial [Mycobacterium avium]|uniref:RsmD family RNA methyltransferase n=1 Tax=Mycobacterium avium TaxID=1764 RepID=UPI002155D8C9